MGPSTQYLQKRNKRKINTQKGIDINDYFKKTEATHRNKKPLTYQQRMELNQKRALEQLKKSGNVNIGQNASKATKFSIKRKKIMNKRMNSNLNSSKPASIQNNKMDVDSNNDLNESSNISSNNTLNSTMDSLTNCDETMRQSESDKISQNVQRFELARKAAEDQTNAFNEDEHMENCNVYVGGLHPDVDQSILRKFFKHCGDIKNIRLDWRNKGFGFVHYSTHEQARECIEDMDGRLIMGQPIKCRWAQNKKKERERERERELMEKNDDINTNHPQQAIYHRRGVGMTNGYNVNNQKGNDARNGVSNNGLNAGDANVSSIGFLSRMTKRKPNRSMPPALVEVNTEKKDDGVENNDGVEYW